MRGIVKGGNNDGGAKILNSILANYVIYAGETISAGDFVAFTNNQAKKSVLSFENGLYPTSPLNMLAFQTGGVVAALLDITHVLVAYVGASNSYYGMAVVLTISGMTVTAGTPFTFESAQVNSLSITALSSTEAVVSYTDAGNSNYGTSIVLSISGTTITAGTPFVHNGASTGYNSVTTLDSAHVLVAYTNYGSLNYGWAVVLTVSGTTLTAGTAFNFKSAATTYIASVTLDSTHVLVAYSDGGNSYYGKAVVLTISGTTITQGTHVTFESANLFTGYTAITALSSTSVLVAYSDGGNSNYGTAVVMTVSGTTITVGTPFVFESAKTTYISVTALDSTHVLVEYRDEGNSNKGTMIILTISGTTITAGTPIIFNSVATTYATVVNIDSIKSFISYVNVGTGYTIADVLRGKRIIEGLATQSGVGGETKKFYDWREII